jgi:uncharacterized protein (DUF983 family)
MSWFSKTTDTYEMIFLKRISDRDGTFTCPKCGKPNLNWSFEQNKGLCDNCDIFYMASDAKPSMPNAPLIESDFWATITVT